ncbi:hypothetical protein L596_028203 [Steinernema carpocapsae]|uniref:C-type lectin domain-containing protein n=1 Tax=Steinernema carpocapsae TaxID=34508 RepID=A0A4U5LXR0_STECR|nr:hypothetical protein L596_028203 [Steinernema carpocapsae]
MLQKIREHCKVVGANIPSCIACPSGFTFTEAFQKCVGIFPIVLNSSITQQKAIIQQCIDRENSALITIENLEQHDELYAMAPEGGTMLLGLIIPEGLSWALNNLRWVSGSTSTYRNFASAQGEPNNAGGGEYFIGLLKYAPYGGLWGDVNFYQIQNNKNLQNVACMKDP